MRESSCREDAVSQQLVGLLEQQISALDELRTLASQEHRFIVHCQTEHLAEVVQQQKVCCGEVRDCSDKIRTFLNQVASPGPSAVKGERPWTLETWIAEHGGPDHGRLSELCRQVEESAQSNRVATEKNATLLQFSLRCVRSAQSLLADASPLKRSNTYARDGVVQSGDRRGSRIQSEV